MERRLRVFEREYKLLEAVARVLETTSKNGYRYKVEDVYLDYGQDWMWTTIVCYGKDGSWQILSPREWKEIVLSFTTDDLMRAISNLMSDRFWLDK